MTAERPRGSLPVVFVTVSIDLLGFGMLLPLLPVYAETFAASSPGGAGVIPVGVLIGMLVSSFPAVQLLAAPYWGRLSDGLGRRPVLMLGLAGSALSHALFGIATEHRSLALLFVSRIAAGISGATISVAHAYVADSTRPESRIDGMALVGAAFGLGSTLGPLCGLLALRGSAEAPGPWPGYVASMLSTTALAWAYFALPESLDPGRPPGGRQPPDGGALRRAWRAPSLGLLLLAALFCTFAFSNFESTLALIVKGRSGAFHLTFRELCLTFAFLGLVSAAVQMGIVRPLARRTSETALASAGIVTEVLGLALLGRAAATGAPTLLFGALVVIVTGFAFATPSLNALISRRSDPSLQGATMGLTQATASLARVAGPLAAVPLLVHAGPSWPLALASSALAAGLVLLLTSARRYPAA